jgi:hypothetical protein
MAAKHHRQRSFHRNHREVRNGLTKMVLKGSNRLNRPNLQALMLNAIDK